MIFFPWVHPGSMLRNATRRWSLFLSDFCKCTPPLPGYLSLLGIMYGHALCMYVWFVESWSEIADSWEWKFLIRGKAGITNLALGKLRMIRWRYRVDFFSTCRIIRPNLSTLGLGATETETFKLFPISVSVYTVSMSWYSELSDL